MHIWKFSSFNAFFFTNSNSWANQRMENNSQCKQRSSNSFKSMGVVRLIILQFSYLLKSFCLVDSVASHLRKWLFFLVLFYLLSPSKYSVISVRNFPSNIGTQMNPHLPAGTLLADVVACVWKTLSVRPVTRLLSLQIFLEHLSLSSSTYLLTSLSESLF